MQFVRIPALAALLIGAIIALGSLAFAQGGSGSSSRIAQFLADPSKLLAQYPDGGDGLVKEVRDLATSQSSTLGPLIDLLATANANQTSAIGTALGEAAVTAVKTDPSYAHTIQSALVAATDAGHRHGASDIGSAQPKIGNTVTTKDEVNGTTERGTQPLLAGNGLYLDEQVHTGTTGKAQFLFADRTNLTVGPVTDIRLDQFVYNPGADGNVVLAATSGTFRFITGIQPHEDYKIQTPFATMGVRGTQFIMSLAPDNEEIQLNSGEVIVTTISNQVVSLNVPGAVLVIDSYGNTTSQPPTNQPIVNFADLGPPVTNTQLADALSSFSAIAGDTTIGAAGGGGGGGGEAGTGGGGGGADPAPTPLNLAIRQPQLADAFQVPSITASAPDIETPTSLGSSVSPSR
jgi:hypothetical protein